MQPAIYVPGEVTPIDGEPDGSVPYFCQWLAGDPYLLDIQPDDKLMIRYFEPDHDEVIRMIRASEGARLPGAIYLPLVLRG